MIKKSKVNSTFNSCCFSGGLPDQFWETAINSAEDYRLIIVSVFATRNKLTDLLENIENKEEKTVIDFGCGIGNAIPFLKKFKKVYAVDSSDNMLNQAKDKYPHQNIIFLRGDLRDIKAPRKSDIGLAISSIWPRMNCEFNMIISNLIKNIKAHGKLYLVLPSLESLTLFYQCIGDHEYKKEGNHFSALNLVNRYVIDSQYTSMGYINTGAGIQKYWLKEEILSVLEKYDFKNMETEKLNLDWEMQIKRTELMEYPNLWFWLIKIGL